MKKRYVSQIYVENAASQIASNENPLEIEDEGDDKNIAKEKVWMKYLPKKIKKDMKERRDNANIRRVDDNKLSLGGFGAAVNYFYPHRNISL
jgi:hypothetical protein